MLALVTKDETEDASIDVVAGGSMFVFDFTDGMINELSQQACNWLHNTQSDQLGHIRFMNVLRMQCK
jgi:hypothetical protein